MIKKFNREKFLKGLKNVAIVAAYAVIAVALMQKMGFAVGAQYTGNITSVDNDLFTKAGAILNTVKGGLLKISAAAVTIAVACGVFMKKFSMGKQDKIETGNKLIRDSIIGFVVLNSMTYITDYIMSISSAASSVK